MKKYLFFAAAALALTACSNDENLTSDDGLVELRLTSGIEVQTRVNTNMQGTSLVNDEKVHAWVYDSKTENAEYQARELTAGNGGTLTGNETMYFPQTGNGVNIFAMHGKFNPSFNEGTAFPGTDGVAFTVEADQSDMGTAYTNSDLLYATKQNVARTKGKVELTFYHMLSKMDIAIVIGDGAPMLADDNAVTITDVITDGTFKPAKTDISEQTARQAMIAAGTRQENMFVSNKVSVNFTESQVTYNEAIIVPQNMFGKKIVFKLADGGTLSYTIPIFDNTPGSAEFESGKRYIYHITLNLTGLEVIAQIEDWVDGDTYFGGAKMR